MNNTKLEEGALVYDANPYKAPELMYGLGIVIKILNEIYATVYWTDWDVIQHVRLEDLEVLNESGQSG